MNGAQSYSETQLLSKYNIYQILMDYWADTLQDDVYVITQDGWEAGRQLRELVAKKGAKLKEEPDLIIKKKKYKAELIPPALIIASCFKEAQSEIEAQQTALDATTQELETLIEENTSSGEGSEEGILNEAMNDKEKVTKATVTARLKVATDANEKELLKQCKALFEFEAEAKKAVKEAQEQLDEKVLKHYAKLSVEDIKTLIVQDKWLATLHANIQAEIERVTQQLANRVKELEERYAEPLPEIVNSVQGLSDRVAGHLEMMGLEW